MEWQLYSETRPPKAGVYQWRLPLESSPGAAVTFFCHHRKRGAGHEDVLSPMFDYWNGYRVIVPAETQWRETPNPPECKKHTETGLDVEGVENLPCPFCKQIPTWKAVQRSNTGGVYISSNPHLYNSWWLECCAWAGKVRFTDPASLMAKRNAMLSGKPPAADKEK